jgi:hypothetical protein
VVGEPFGVTQDMAGEIGRWNLRRGPRASDGLGCG